MKTRVATYDLSVIPQKRFRLLAVDPPWPFKDRLPGRKRGAATHYPLMSLEEITALRLTERPGLVAEHAHLYLWAPGQFVGPAITICKQWGFTPSSLLVWVKVRRVKTGELHLGFGMGWNYRSCTEFVVFGVRGKGEKARTRKRDRRNLFFAEVGEHSEKPDLFYEIAEEMSYGPRLELFARRQRAGWTTILS